ncbi:MAG: hypothetical protein EXQ85_05795 [Alphaproteobacteria bacterium]|nr:hypothetical protein [Alphaproteobacteria bacterium]
MTAASVIYCVRSWVDPAHGQPYLDWLETKHMREVLMQPGVRWAKRVVLDQTDANGWRGYLLMYGLTDRTALDGYLSGDARLGFWRELEAFKDIHYSERFWGDVDLTIAPPN